jgi:hypothetical protein
VEIKERLRLIGRILLVPSLVEYVLLHELGSLPPPKDVEVVAALMNILSSPRGHKIANHMDAQSKQLMVSLFGGETITFDSQKSLNRKNVLYDSSTQSLRTIERLEEGRLVGSREAIHEDCLMPLPSNETIYFN